MIDDTPENASNPLDDRLGIAENMKLRSTLMMALERHVRAGGWTQVEAARQLGVTQPRMSDLFRGKVNLFSLDTLVKMAVTAGLRVEIRIEEPA